MGKGKKQLGIHLGNVGQITIKRFLVHTADGGFSNKEASQMCNGRQFLIVGLVDLEMVCDQIDGLLNKSEHCREAAFVHKAVRVGSSRIDIVAFN